MEIASFAVALAGLALSIINAIVLAKQRLVRISLTNTSCVYIEDASIYLDFFLTNKSSLPISVTGAVIYPRYNHGIHNEWTYSDSVENTHTSDGPVVDRQSVPLSSLLPVDVPAYTAKRIVLQFPPRGELCKHLQQLRVQNRRPIRIRLCTSRGTRLLRTRLRFPDPALWVRGYLHRKL